MLAQLVALGFDQKEVISLLQCREGLTKQVPFDPELTFHQSTVMYFLFKDHKAIEFRRSSSRKLMERRNSSPMMPPKNEKNRTIKRVDSTPFMAPAPVGTEKPHVQAMERSETTLPTDSPKVSRKFMKMVGHGLAKRCKKMNFLRGSHKILETFRHSKEQVLKAS